MKKRGTDTNDPKCPDNDTIALLIQIPPEEIAFLSFILESYEGVAIARTIDPHQGLLELMVSPDYQEEIREILKDLSRQFPIKESTFAKG